MSTRPRNAEYLLDGEAFGPMPINTRIIGPLAPIQHSEPSWSRMLDHSELPKTANPHVKADGSLPDANAFRRVDEED